MHSAMEQTRYWMWTRKLSKRSSPNKLGSSGQIHTAVSATSSPYVYETWEERAFAEDSAGHLGGCIWPPRSYTCSFCRREFQSAQALGGHMNVHRRDRARLKQSLSPRTGADDDDSDHDPPYNSSSKPTVLPASPLSPRVPVASTPEIVSTHALFSPSYDSSVNVQENKVDSCFDTTTRSFFMDLVPAPQICIPELKLGSENLNLRSDSSKEEEEEEGNMINIKRQRTDFKLSIAMRTSSSIQQKHPAQVLKHSPCPVEELDLELRLGQKRKPVMVE